MNRRGIDSVIWNRLVAIAWAAVMLTTAVGCVPRSENEVVIYSAADREVATPILAAFERRNPETKVASTFDVESTKTVGLVTRIENESRFTSL